MDQLNCRGISQTICEGVFELQMHVWLCLWCTCVWVLMNSESPQNLSQRNNQWNQPGNCLERRHSLLCSYRPIQLLPNAQRCVTRLQNWRLYKVFSLPHTDTHTLTNTHIQANFSRQHNNQTRSWWILAWSLRSSLFPLRAPRAARSGGHVLWNQHVCSVLPGGSQAQPTVARSAAICQAHYSHKCDGCKSSEWETVGGMKR